jgi:hypothetical protein
VQEITPPEQEVPPVVHFQTCTPGGGMKVQHKPIGKLKTSKQLNTGLVSIDYIVRPTKLMLILTRANLASFD